MQQDQFLDVIDRDEAERRFFAGIDSSPRGVESVGLAEALGRVLAEDVLAPVDVPGFDRANVDGFAVRAADTFGAFEEDVRTLRVNDEVIATGVAPQLEVEPGTATPIATGAVLPRGADAVVMVEYTEVEGTSVQVSRPATPGSHVSHAGSDLARGETVLHAGAVLSSREVGVLAAIGCARVPVRARPRVAILSTGDEIIAPGEPMIPGGIYDSNAAILAAAVTELGGAPLPLGIVPDDPDAVRDALASALATADLVLLSGGTSKGAGDLNHRVLADYPEASILAHGVALKPGKPICLAAVGRTPVVILPGFPTSAIFTFHELVAPVLRRMAGLTGADDRQLVEATLPMQVNSDKGRTEFLLVGLAEGDRGLAAYPMGKGSGSVTTFSRADGFLTIPRQTEIVEEGSPVTVQLLGSRVRMPDLTVIGSHCVGLDVLLGRLSRRGIRSRFLAVGSGGGLTAARRGECDLAGIHLLDPETGVYNEPFCGDDLELVRGYGRMQGVVYRRDDLRFAERANAAEGVAVALADASCILVNRNRGSGTRALVDQLLGERRPQGFAVEVRSHNAVAAAVAAGRADWGVAIETVARQYDLGFLPITEERFDFVVPTARWERPAVVAFRQLLADDGVRAELERLGFHMPREDHEAEEEA